MSVKWFTATRATSGTPAPDPCRIIFTTKPKGIRVNATMTRLILETEKKHLRVGFDLDKKVILMQPCDSGVEAFKFVTNKNSGQICSATIWSWAVQNNLQMARLSGCWDETQKAFVFIIP